MYTMIPQSSQRSRFVFLAALFLAAVASTEARRCGNGSCGSLAPRTYRYNRDPFSLVGDIFSMPLYPNSLLMRRGLGNAEPSRLAESTTPRYDISEDCEAGVVELTMELPGVSAKDLDIELENENQLRIRGLRKIRYHGTWVRSEFDQIFQLDHNVDTERLEASLAAGILSVRVPKREKHVKKIAIVSEDEPDAIELTGTDPKQSSVTQSEGTKTEEIDGLEVITEED